MRHVQAAQGQHTVWQQKLIGNQTTTPRNNVSNREASNFESTESMLHIGGSLRLALARKLPKFTRAIASLATSPADCLLDGGTQKS
jgi:hypothetical protein